MLPSCHASSRANFYWCISSKFATTMLKSRFNRNDYPTKNGRSYVTWYTNWTMALRFADRFAFYRFASSRFTHIYCWFLNKTNIYSIQRLTLPSPVVCLLCDVRHWLLKNFICWYVCDSKYSYFHSFQFLLCSSCWILSYSSCHSMESIWLTYILWPIVTTHFSLQQ